MFRIFSRTLTGLRPIKSDLQLSSRNYYTHSFYKNLNQDTVIDAQSTRHIENNIRNKLLQEQPLLNEHEIQKIVADGLTQAQEIKQQKMLAFFRNLTKNHSSNIQLMIDQFKKHLLTIDPQENNNSSTRSRKNKLLVDLHNTSKLNLHANDHAMAAIHLGNNKILETVARYLLYMDITVHGWHLSIHFNSNYYQLALRVLTFFGGKNKSAEAVFADLDLFIKTHMDTTKEDILNKTICLLPEQYDLMTMGSWEKWTALMTKSGPRALKLSTYAKQIEARLGRVPDHYQEAIDQAIYFVYPRANKNPVIASYCFEYGHNEEIFNRCLALEKKRKPYDYLPDICINGSQHGFPGYYLIKLPANAPEAYFLGNFTDCCMHIDGIAYGPQCIMDGIQYKNNGFYVLVNIKKKNSGMQPFLPDGEFNRKHFYIVGCGYACISRDSEALLIDSWENHKNKNDPNPISNSYYDTIIETLLPIMAKQLVTAENSKLKAVLIGVGDNSGTPAYWKNHQHYCYPAKIREGQQSPDSALQAVVFATPEYANKNQLSKQSVHTRTYDDLLKAVHKLNLRLGDMNLFSTNQRAIEFILKNMGTIQLANLVKNADCGILDLYLIYQDERIYQHLINKIIANIDDATLLTLIKNPLDLHHILFYSNQDNDAKYLNIDSRRLALIEGIDVSFFRALLDSTTEPLSFLSKFELNRLQERIEAESYIYKRR